jgi:hypothetical protein
LTCFLLVINNLIRSTSGIKMNQKWIVIEVSSESSGDNQNKSMNCATAIVQRERANELERASLNDDDNDT